KSTIAELREIVVILKLLLTQLLAFKPLRALQQKSPFRSEGKPKPSQSTVVLGPEFKRKWQPQVRRGEAVFGVVDIRIFPIQRGGVFQKVDIFPQPKVR